MNVAGRDSTTVYHYDGAGRLGSETVPYDGKDAEPGARTTYEYDNLNQPRLITQHDGSTIRIDRSHPLTVDITETGNSAEAGNPVRHTVITKTEDGLVSSVRETSTSGPVSVRGLDYVYGQGQELEQVTELGGPTTTYTYFGQPKPITVTDAEHGETTIQYDGFSQVRHVQHDPAYPSTIDYTYDALGRVKRIVTEQPDPNNAKVMISGETGYTYDQGPGAIGQRSLMRAASSFEGTTSSGCQ